MALNTVTKMSDTTVVDTHETKYTWLLKNIRNGPCEKGGHFPSPEFDVGPNKEFPWRLELYLNGFDDENYVGIWPELLDIDEYDDFKDALIEISIEDEKNGANITKRKYLSKENLMSREDDNVFMKFIKMDDLLKIPSFFERGDLKIVCRIFLYGFVYRERDPNVARNGAKKMKEHLADYEKLLFDDEFSDFQLIIGDSKIPVHRAILASRSRQFWTLLTEDMLDKNDESATIKDMDVEVMRELIRFVYIGQVRNLDKIADKLLIAADRYNLKPIKERCENALVIKLSPESIFATLRFADEHDAATLKKAAIEYITRNAKQLAANDDFEESVKLLSPELYLQFMRALIAEI